MKKLILIFVVSTVNVVQSKNPEDIGPWLHSVTEDAITIMLETKNKVKVSVFIGESEDENIIAFTDSIATNLHKMEVTGLIPDFRYYYECRWSNDKIVSGSFKTAPNNISKPIRVALYGDSRSASELHKKIANEIYLYDPDIVLHSGDLVGDGRRKELWDKEFFIPANQLLRHTPIYPVLGNHERDSQYYYNYFPLNDNKPWWSKRYGPVQLIGLHYGKPTGPESEQYNWLVEELQKCIAMPWIIIIVHYPLYHVHPSRPIYEIREHWQPVFEKYGVDLVIAGHDHYYFRSHPIRKNKNAKGFIQLISGGGGAKLYPIIDRPYTATAVSDYHYVIMEINEDSINGTAINLDGDTIDRFTID